MQASETKHRSVQGQHFRQRELQPQGKQQENQPQFGELRQLFIFVDPVESGRPDHQPDTQVAQHGGESQSLEQSDDHQGGGEDDQQTGEHGKLLGGQGFSSVEGKHTVSIGQLPTKTTDMRQVVAAILMLLGYSPDNSMARRFSKAGLI
ncbi:hypothetical protein D3C86_1469660 [compost metagenome]